MSNQTITLDQFQIEVEKYLLMTDFYDKVIMFCGAKGSLTYNMVIESAALVIFNAYHNGVPVEEAASELIFACNKAMESCSIEMTKN